ATGTITPTVLAALDAGKHTILVRALDSAGNWGVVGGAIFNLPKTGPQTTSGSALDIPANGLAPVSISATGDDSAAAGTITNAEYFIDTVGANGAGTAMLVNRTASIVSVDADIAAATVHALTEGTHHVFVHSKDSLGLWGPPLDIPLPVDFTGPGVDAASVGPNPNNGTVSDKSNPGYVAISAQITDRDAGHALQNPIADAEAFLDPKVANPAGGTGLQLVAVDGVLDSTTEAFYGLIPLSQIKALTTGTHHVFVRGMDTAGNWGVLFGVDLIIDKIAPVLGTLSATPNPTNGAANVTLSAPLTEANTLSVAEFWVGTVDPGAGKGTAVPFGVAAGTVSATVPLAGVPAGANQFNLRVQDKAGNWSLAVSRSVTVQKPNAIFADTFDGGTLSSWSSITGTPSVMPAAGIPAGGTNKGMQVTLLGTNQNVASYVTDTTPAAEATYHAKFSFDPNTLTSGTNPTTAVLTILQAQTATAGQVFAVQYRVSGALKQVRTVMSRSGTTAVTNGAWVTLAAGAHTLQVDWKAGPATGATAGSLTLSVDGVLAYVSTGNTSTLRVETVRLGVIAGFSNGTGSTRSRGTAWFDSFVSVRNLPF
ncbi:MAG: hypothetical protein QOJ62_1224, partial [Actinomycetota bacterium]|nr:hypothetical protein [Actinomycetota bacterium]